MDLRPPRGTLDLLILKSPLSFVLVGALVAAVVVAATLVPAVQGIRAAPLAALREG